MTRKLTAKIGSTLGTERTRMGLVHCNNCSMFVPARNLSLQEETWCLMQEGGHKKIKEIVLITMVNHWLKA